MTKLPAHIQESLVYSSRLTGAQKYKNTAGASCNLYRVEDSIKSIGHMAAKLHNVCYTEGAAAIDISNLRAKGSVVDGGRTTSSGSISFALNYDRIVHSMKRTEKKNNSGLILLRYDHQDLQEFIDVRFSSMFKAIIMPRSGTFAAYKLARDIDKLKIIAKAYDENEAFLIQEPKEARTVNLCTEIEASPDNICSLMAHNLAAYQDADELVTFLPEAFRQSIAEMDRLYKEYVVTRCVEMGVVDNVPPKGEKQIGLGLFGLSSLLGRLGVTYAELATSMENLNVDDRIVRIETEADKIAFALHRAYNSNIRLIERLGYRAAYCIQPTVSTSVRSKDYESYTCSAEVAPVTAYKDANGCHTMVISEVRNKGQNKRISFHPKTWTREEVAYADYQSFSSEWQKMVDATGLAHRHSHCYYGEEFDAAKLHTWLTTPTGFGAIKSLYYRLPNLVHTVDKTDVSGGVKELGVDFDIDSMLGCGYTTELPACESCAM